jgi:hypothetical protein
VRHLTPLLDCFYVRQPFRPGAPGRHIEVVREHERAKTEAAGENDEHGRTEEHRVYP